MNPVTSLTASASAAVLLGKLGNLKRPQTPVVDKTNPFIGYFHKGSAPPPPPHRLHHAPRPKHAPNKQYHAHQRFAEYLSTSSSRHYEPKSTNNKHHTNNARSKLLEQHSTTSSTTSTAPSSASPSPMLDAPFSRRNSSVDLARAGDRPVAPAPLTTLPYFAARFNQDFKSLRVLGQGGQGCVTEVESKLDHKRYAIKKVRVQATTDGREKNRHLTQSLREVHLMANLPRHPNIVRYYTSWLEDEADDAVAPSVDDDDEASMASEEFLSYDDAGSSCGFEFESAEDLMAEPAASVEAPTKARSSSPSINLFIQMELCKQTESISNLASWLRSNSDDRVKTSSGHAMAMQLFTDVVRGVKHIHAFGVIHRDIKPDNIFLQNGVAKIGDFGLSKHMHEATSVDDSNGFSPSPSLSESPTTRTSHTTALGTFLYASPEQVGRGQVPKSTFYSEKSDIFALGVMLLELCSSFSTIMERVQVLTAVRHGVVPAAAQKAFPLEMGLVAKMTALDPRDRYVHSCCCSLVMRKCVCC
ncbi:PEK protein kinase [Saprolegnia parasitica CBS 223.65]|uniref:non-specific serine/threonine protein kinase n=1 Tax=Saprolegnia parasitica (strain CBS 223.65) TaxID=695850 RepID=A0A067C3I6_SAPPC|nr:PEK protein kinase [Saprolegnia parasitica CBS 223.65]KDO23665.1 PEK protein kinase [Saprolegnia parasitica CBS 223.65]|eukprot:XP_012205648.1 PEK protein kinase [Saprolegnia parasitica CBS 223.65]